MIKHKTNNVLDLFENSQLVKISAPMVRYSKLQFRSLLRQYSCDLCFTPMILADSFCKSFKARNNEFTTNNIDCPLITQFAANTVDDFVGAAQLISPYCDGVDLNCGCPQRWSRQKGLGCVMLEKPNLIYDLVRECRNRINRPFTVSVKMRLCKELKDTIEICKQLEHCSISFLTVHGRTPDNSTGSVDVESLKLIKESIGIPFIANGGIKTLEDCKYLKEITNCQGVMVANGLLNNPTLFNGTETTTLDCIQNWLNICYNSTLSSYQNNINNLIYEKPNYLTFQCFHHHLVFMLAKILPRKQRQIFNQLQNFQSVIEFLNNYFNIQPQLFKNDEFYRNKIIDLNFEGYKCDNSIGDDFYYNYYDCNKNNGKFFLQKTKTLDECDWSNMFLEND